MAASDALEDAWLDGAALKAAFEHIDAKHDVKGSFSRAQLRESLKDAKIRRLLQLPKYIIADHEEAAFDATFTSMDGDHDAAVTFEEFMRYARLFSDHHAHHFKVAMERAVRSSGSDLGHLEQAWLDGATLKAAFDRIDSKGDGHFSRVQLKEGLKDPEIRLMLQLPKYIIADHEEAAFDDTFTDMDGDHDAAVNFEEFMRYARLFSHQHGKHSRAVLEAVAVGTRLAPPQASVVDELTSGVQKLAAELSTVRGSLAAMPSKEAAAAPEEEEVMLKSARAKDLASLLMARNDTKGENVDLASQLTALMQEVEGRLVTRMDVVKQKCLEPTAEGGAPSEEGSREAEDEALATAAMGHSDEDIAFLESALNRYRAFLNAGDSDSAASRVAHIYALLAQALARSGRGDEARKKEREKSEAASGGAKNIAERRKKAQRQRREWVD